MKVCRPLAFRTITAFLIVALALPASAAIDVEIGTESGPEGLSTVFMDEDGFPCGLMKAEWVRLRPLRMGFFRTNLSRIPTLIECRIELQSVHAMKELTRLLRIISPAGVVRFETVAFIFPETVILASEAEWRRGVLRLQGPASVDGVPVSCSRYSPRIHRDGSELTLTISDNASSITLLNSNPDNP